MHQAWIRVGIVRSSRIETLGVDTDKSFRRPASTSSVKRAHCELKSASRVAFSLLSYVLRRQNEALNICSVEREALTMAHVGLRVPDDLLKTIDGRWRGCRNLLIRWWS
jgi:hypothetical protein